MLVYNHKPDISDGVLPGDVIISINGVDAKDMSLEELNGKLTSPSLKELKVVVLPSEECVEFSIRLFNLLDPSIPSESNILKMDKSGHNRIYLRGWIGENDTFNGISGAIKEVVIYFK